MNFCASSCQQLLLVRDPEYWAKAQGHRLHLRMGRWNSPSGITSLEAIVQSRGNWTASHTLKPQVMPSSCSQLHVLLKQLPANSPLFILLLLGKGPAFVAAAFLLMVNKTLHLLGKPLQDLPVSHPDPPSNSSLVFWHYNPKVIAVRSRLQSSTLQSGLLKAVLLQQRLICSPYGCYPQNLLNSASVPENKELRMTPPNPNLIVKGEFLPREGQQDELKALTKEPHSLTFNSAPESIQGLLLTWDKLGRNVCKLHKPRQYFWVIRLHEIVALISLFSFPLL